MCVAVKRGGQSRLTKDTVKIPKLSAMESWLPKSVFHKDVTKSVYYLLRDGAAVLAGFGALYTLPENAFFMALPLVIRWATCMALQCFTGFFMWCMFVVGHDCGHGTFSNSKPFNRVIGEIAHSVILCVPYIPWSLSHHQHHLYHNHETKDYSHFWVKHTEEWLAAHQTNKVMYALRPLFPFLAWPFYIYGGFVDGAHILCGQGRLWEGRPMWQVADGWISASVALTTMYAIGSTLGWAALHVYVAPWFVFSYFLFTVTYLQHHEPETVVYGDETWSYVRGAFETIDRTFGAGIDDIHHNITDGHVVHHIFFTKIPHYNLKVATAALKKGLTDNGFGHLYKHRDTRNFVTYIFSYVCEHFFFISTDRVFP